MIRPKYLVFMWLLCPLIVFGQTTGYSKQEIEKLVLRYAPVVYQEYRDDIEKGYQFYKEGDFIIKVDFDGNWNGCDNWENCIPASPDADFSGAAYYSVIGTDTHWFLGYHYFHAVDDDYHVSGRHENDMEFVFVCVDKKTEKVILMLTRAHTRFMTYSVDPKISKKSIHFEGERPVITISSNGSGFYKGHAIFGFDPIDFQKNRKVIVYDPTLGKGTVPDVDAVGERFLYELIDVKVLFDQLGNDELYLTPADFVGDTYGSGAEPPWTKRNKFFDPGKLFIKHFKLKKSEMSRKYTYFPYAEEQEHYERLMDEFD